MVINSWKICKSSGPVQRGSEQGPCAFMRASRIYFEDIIIGIPRRHSYKRASRYILLRTSQKLVPPLQVKLVDDITKNFTRIILRLW
jgi:hypothetical protein